MVWRLHDLIHLRIVDERVPVAEENSNLDTLEILDILDKVLDVDQHVDWLTFSPQHYEILEAFNQIIRSNHKYITTAQQVIKFVEYCVDNFSDKSDINFNLSKMYDYTHSVHFPDDLLVVIELED